MKNALGVRLANIRDVSIYLKPSWFILMLIICLGYGLYLMQYPLIDAISAFTISCTVAVLLAVGVLVHELAHAVTGKAFGLRVEYISMTLWGGVTKLTPGSPLNSFLVSIAGPIVNALYAFVLMAISHSLSASALTSGIGLAADANLMISIFNLIPSYPLDGGHALEAAITAISKKRSTGAKITAIVGLCLIPILVAGTIFTGLWASTLGIFLTIMIGYYLWNGSFPMLRALDRQANGSDPLSARNLSRSALVLPNSTTREQVRTQWDDASPLVLCEAGQPVAWVEPSRLQSWLSQETTQLADFVQPLAPMSIDSSMLRIDVMEYFNGHFYRKLPPAMKSGLRPIAWAVTDKNQNICGIITHQEIDAKLFLERSTLQLGS